MFVAYRSGIRSKTRQGSRPESAVPVLATGCIAVPRQQPLTVIIRHTIFYSLCAVPAFFGIIHRDSDFWPGVRSTRGEIPL